jgi:hypothetical protein
MRYITSTSPTACNGLQVRAEYSAYVSGIYKDVQSLETPQISLVMSRSAVRVRSSALLLF